MNYLFEDKEKAKSLGARWYGDSKEWHMPAGLDTRLLEKGI